MSHRLTLTAIVGHGGLFGVPGACCLLLLATWSLPGVPGVPGACCLMGRNRVPKSCGNTDAPASSSSAPLTKKQQKKAIELREKADAEYVAQQRRDNHVTAIQEGTLKFFDSKAMLNRVFEMKSASYKEMEAHGEEFLRIMRNTKLKEPDHTNVAEYAKWMSSMACVGHEYTAHVAKHMLEAQKLEYETLADYMQDSFTLCNECMVYALEVVQDSSREVNAKLKETQEISPEILRKKQQGEFESLKLKVSMLEQELAGLRTTVSLQNMSLQLHSRPASQERSLRGRSRYSQEWSSRQPSPSPSQAMMAAEQDRINRTYLRKGDVAGAIEDAQKVAAWREGYDSEDLDAFSMCGSHAGCDKECSSGHSGTQLFR